MNKQALYLAREIRRIDDKEARGEISLEEAAKAHNRICWKARRLNAYEDMRRLHRAIEALAI